MLNTATTQRISGRCQRRRVGAPLITNDHLAQRAAGGHQVADDWSRLVEDALSDREPPSGRLDTCPRNRVRLSTRLALRVDVTPERAAAAFSMMTSATGWRQLTEGTGWTFDEGEAWLANSLCQLLLKDGP
jgi:hypothetical protein